jgi:hypothetical protein
LIRHKEDCFLSEQATNTLLKDEFAHVLIAWKWDGKKKKK